VDVRVSAQLSGGQYDAEAGKFNNANSNYSAKYGFVVPEYSNYGSSQAKLAIFASDHTNVTQLLYLTQQLLFFINTLHHDYYH